MEKPKILTGYFEGDHARLDLVFEQFRRKKNESPEAAKAYFKIFNNGLKRHIVWEEDVLFPAFEQKSGLRDRGPTIVMREEHRRIGEILERIHDKVRKGDPSSGEEEERLLAILSSHNEKEELAIYPAMDRLMSEEETAALFLAMENIPAERYQTCCGGQRHHNEAKA